MARTTVVRLELGVGLESLIRDFLGFMRENALQRADHCASTKGMESSLKLAGTGPTWRELVESFGEDMTRRGCKKQSVYHFRRYVDQCAAFANWNSPSSITLQGAMEFLADRRKTTWSGTTHDQACSALRSFGSFLHKIGAVESNPLVHLEASGETGEAGARPATTEEFRALIAASIQRVNRDLKSKINAPLFYCWLGYTGLRSGDEARKCAWGDIEGLDSDTPYLWTSPKWSKNKKRMRVAIAPQLAQLLRTHKKTVKCGDSDPVFAKAPQRRTFDDDRETAGIKKENADGRFTYHSLRKWLSVELDRSGCTPAVRYRMMRHSGNITNDKYFLSDLASEVSAVQALPLVWPDSLPLPGRFSAQSLLHDNKPVDILPVAMSSKPTTTVEPRAAVQSDDMAVTSSGGVRLSGQGVGNGPGSDQAPFGSTSRIVGGPASGTTFVDAGASLVTGSSRRSGEAQLHTPKVRGASGPSLMLGNGQGEAPEARITDTPLALPGSAGESSHARPGQSDRQTGASLAGRNDGAAVVGMSDPDSGTAACDQDSGLHARGGDARIDRPISDDARRIRIIIAALTEAGLLALAAALLIAADPAPHFHDQVVTNPPMTGR